MTRKRIWYPTSEGHQCDSKFERDVLQDLIDGGVRFEFHPTEREYSTPVIGGFCKDCDSNNVRQGRSYTPDLRLLPSGLLVEIKGKFAPHQRGLMTHFVRQYDGPIAFVFMRDNKMTKQGFRRYSHWANGLHCAWAIGRIPHEWSDDLPPVYTKRVIS